MKRLYYLIAALCLLAGSIYAQNPDSLKQALVRSKSVPFSNQTQTYYPEMDCVGAIPICTDTLISTIQYAGYGYYQDLSNITSCLGAGEVNGVWYKLYIKETGLLGFNIVPNDSMDDYDWTLFNLTGRFCREIFTNPSLEISCNFSGLTGITGANLDSLIVTASANELKVSVLEDNIYYLYISFFRDSAFPPSDPSGGNSPDNQSGYTIDFSISTCSIDSCLQQVITTVKEDEFNFSTHIFPNPTSQNITLTLNTLKTGQSYSMQLFTATGALVRTVSNIKAAENTVDVSGLATGLYYYRIVTTDGNNAAGRFVKE